MICSPFGSPDSPTISETQTSAGSGTPTDLASPWITSIRWWGSGRWTRSRAYSKEDGKEFEAHTPCGPRLDAESGQDCVLAGADINHGLSLT